MLVGLSDGSIHLLDLKGDNGTTIQKELRPEDNEHPILQIEIDHLQVSRSSITTHTPHLRKVYILLEERKGSVDAGSVIAEMKPSWRQALFNSFKT